MFGDAKSTAFSKISASALGAKYTPAVAESAVTVGTGKAAVKRNLVNLAAEFFFYRYELRVVYFIEFLNVIYVTAQV